MIYRLFYVEFEDYVKHMHNFVSSLPLIVFYLFTALFSIFTMNPTVWLVLLAHFIKVVMVISLEVLKRRQYVLINSQSFEQRKVVYEFIHNFKQFTLKNLHDRYTQESKK